MKNLSTLKAFTNIKSFSNIKTFSRHGFLHNFIKCGITGWCIEILFTGLHSLRCRNMQLKGNTSLWMFPIYGSAALLTPLFRLLRNKSLWLRGFTYMSLIFSAEYLSGSLLARRKICPWDYYRSRWNIKRYIRLDYAPFWFLAGLLFERLLSEPPKQEQP